MRADDHTGLVAHMSWRVVDHSTVYRQTGHYATAPNVVRTPAGNLLVLFHRSPHLGHAHHSHPLFDVQAVVSSNEGLTWSEPRLVTNDPRGGVIDFGSHTLADGSIFLHASSNELVPAAGRAHFRFLSPPHAKAIGSDTHSAWVSRPGVPFWVRSRDDGRTWSSPTRFPRLPDAVWGSPAEHSGVCRGGLLQLGEGRLLMPSKATDQPDGEQPYFGMLRISDDMGDTWTYGGRIAEDPVAHFSEPAIHRTPDGRIVVLYRCHPRGSPRITASDGKGNTTIARVESDDEGQTWSHWRPTSVWGSPCHMLRLSDGRAFVSVGTRWEGQRGCIVRVANPTCTDLDSTPELIVRSDSATGDCGYPWAVELSGGRVLVVYYYTYRDLHRGIEATLVEEV